MLEDLNEEIFSQQLDTAFQVDVLPSQSVELKLVEIRGESNGLPKVAGQESFALYFTGPDSSFLPQRSYPMRHEQLGDLEIFLVPIAKEADGYRYEAIFNRLSR